MKRLSIAVALILSVAACSETPTGTTLIFSDPFGTLTLSVGPEASTIINAIDGANVPTLVASAWAEQKAIDYESLVAETADLVAEDNPEVIELTQTRILPVVTSATGKRSPSAVGIPDFAPLLRETLRDKGKFFNIHSQKSMFDTVVLMAVDGRPDIEMRLVVTESLLTRPHWIP